MIETLSHELEKSGYWVKTLGDTFQLAQKGGRLLGNLSQRRRAIPFCREQQQSCLCLIANYVVVAVTGVFAFAKFARVCTQNSNNFNNFATNFSSLVWTKLKYKAELNSTAMAFGEIICQICLALVDRTSLLVYSTR